MKIPMKPLIVVFMILSIIGFIFFGMYTSKNEEIKVLEQEINFYYSKRQELIDKQSDLNELITILNQNLLLQQEKTLLLEQELNSLTEEKSLLEQIKQNTPTQEIITTPPAPKRTTRAS